MTTASSAHEAGHRAAAAGAGVRGAFTATVVAGLGAVVLGWAVAGSAAALGAALGATLVSVFFGAGALVLGVVARLAPAASLLVALLTYTLKVVLLALVFVGLNRSGVLGDGLDPRWLGGTVIGCTVVWLTAQIVAATRARQPLYELEEASVR